MKTTQNSIWMRFLVTGLLINLMTSAFSCKKTVEYIQHAEHIYINETNYTITFQKGDVLVTIKPKDITSFKITEDASKVVSEDSFKQTPQPFDFYNNYKIIKFNNAKCLDLSVLEINNPSNLKYYKAERIDARSYKFTFTFTEADYNRAVTCP